MLGVTILGNNSAVPAFDRHPTSQVVTTNKTVLLVDCGEGTQTQLIRYKIRRSHISHVFISHLHGDHYFGLIGLITSFALFGRTQSLTIVAPKELEQIILLQLKAADTQLPYELHFHHLTEEGFLFRIDKVAVYCFRTFHRIECFGFVFKEIKSPRKVNHEMAELYQVPFHVYDELRHGQDYINTDGVTIANDVLTTPAKKGDSYAYCADTKYDERLLPFIQGVDMMYHEATYLDAFADRATLRFHATTRQAATMALKAGVKKLLIGHFSSRYQTLDDFETEAREVFPETYLALEGASYWV